LLAGWLAGWLTGWLVGWLTVLNLIVGLRIYTLLWNPNMLFSSKTPHPWALCRKINQFHIRASVRDQGSHRHFSCPCAVREISWFYALRINVVKTGS
jgi:hypothetical protein